MGQWTNKQEFNIHEGFKKRIDKVMGTGKCEIYTSKSQKSNEKNTREKKKKNRLVDIRSRSQPT